MNEDLMTTAELGRQLGLSPDAIRYHVRKGNLIPARITPLGRHYLFSMATARLVDPVRREQPEASQPGSLDELIASSGPALNRRKAFIDGMVPSDPTEFVPGSGQTTVTSIAIPGLAF